MASKLKVHIPSYPAIALLVISPAEKSDHRCTEDTDIYEDMYVVSSLQPPPKKKKTW